MYPWWGKQFLTKRSLPRFMSCLIGLKGSSFEISIFAFVQRGTSTTMFKMPLFWSAKRGMSWKGETTLPFCCVYMRCSRDDVEIWLHDAMYGTIRTERVRRLDEPRSVFCPNNVRQTSSAIANTSGTYRRPLRCGGGWQQRWQKQVDAQSETIAALLNSSLESGRVFMRCNPPMRHDNRLDSI